MDGLKLTGKPANIPGCSRTELPAFFKEMGYKYGAEIGVLTGLFTKRFCDEGMKMLAVDPWAPYYGDRDRTRQEKFYNDTCALLAPYDCRVIRKSSMDAAAEIPKESLDFVYIDSDHRFKETAEDIVEWGKRVRPGGIVAGHDYFTSLPWARRFRCQVGAIVDAYVKCFGVENFYTLGELDPKTEPIYGGWYPSWFFIKK